MDKLTLFLVDDHAVLRAGLKQLLNAESDMEVIGEADNGMDAVRMCEELHPDIVLLDISMPGLSGEATLKLMTSRCPDTRVLVVSMHEDECYVREMLKAGACGYLPKRAADVELLAAIRSTAKGECYVHSSLTAALLADVGQLKGTQFKKAKELSQREKEVLYLLAMGHSNQQIAERLFLSIKTVDTYKQRIKEKLDIHGRSELVRYAIDNGILTAGNLT